jgi:ABC-type maltose transport system permease subunit
MKEKKNEGSVALSIITTTATFLLITILIIMPYMVQQNSIEVQNNNNSNISSSSSTIPTNNTINTNNTLNSISLFLAKGYVNGKIAFFIATDASDNQTAASITKNPGFKVNFAPALALSLESTRQQGYEFINGVRGEGSFGFQLPVASALPGDKNYTPLVQLNFVKWNSNSSFTSTVTVRELKSVDEIMAAQKNGELTIAKTNIVINSPAVVR